MASEDFEEIVKSEFSFLVEEFGFCLADIKKTAMGYDALFTNDTTAVRISYEFREAYLFVTIYRLIHGKFVDNPRPIHHNSVLTGFALDDVLTLRNPAAAMKPAYAYGVTSEYYHPERGLKLFVGKFADNLKRFAADMLRGDFRLFKELDLIVKRRASSS